MTRTIAVAGRKGGTGKTTTAVNVAGWLATQGERVLLVDLDPQGNATKIIGPGHSDAVWRLLVRRDPLPELIASVRPNLDILPGGEDTAVAGKVLAVQSTTDPRGSMHALSKALARAPHTVVIVDCPPSLDLLTINGILAATEIALPVPCQYLGAEGARQFVELAAELSSGSGPKLRWVIPTMYRETNWGASILESLTDFFGGQVLTDPVRFTVRIDEAAGHHQTIFEYDPRGAGALDYERVARRIHGSEA